MLEFYLHNRQLLPDLLQVRLSHLRALLRHLLVQHRHLQLLLCVYYPSLRQLRELLRICELAPGRDELRLLLVKLRLKLRAEGDEGLGLGKARLELADVPRVVRTLRLEYADLRAQLLQLRVIYNSLRRLCI